MDISKLLSKADDDQVFLDNAASTQPLPELIDVLSDICGFGFVNASAVTTRSSTLKRVIGKLSDSFKAAARLEDAEFIWTAGGTEANNLALLGSSPVNDSWIGREIVTSVVEHPSVDQPLRILEGRGAIVRRVPVDGSGKLDLKAFEASLSGATHLVSLCMVQGETGAIQDLVAVRECMDRRSPRARLHVDAVQGLTKVDIPWKEADIDLVSFSGHKFHALGGTGLLAMKKGITLMPMIHGGGQQGGIRNGSLDGIGIISFLFSAITLLERADELRSATTALNDRMRDGIRAVFPDAIFNSAKDGSPFILNVSFPGYEGAVLMRLLDSMGVTVATGSACSAEGGGPSQALSAMGLDRKTAFAATRISFGCTTTTHEVDLFLERLETALQRY